MSTVCTVQNSYCVLYQNENKHALMVTTKDYILIVVKYIVHSSRETCIMAVMVFYW